MRGLRDEDSATVPASDGTTALRLATAGVCAAVLDIGLPDADGRDVCRAMRANGFLSPVVLLAAHHPLSDRLSGFSAGGDDYLPKPFHVAVRAYRAPDAVQGEVVDDGPGVPPPVRRTQLFEPGRRAEPGDGHGGAGLGLPPARRLARSAGGEVTYDPGHTSGARFVVSLSAG